MGEDRHEHLMKLVEGKDDTVDGLTFDQVCSPILLEKGQSADGEVTENAFQWSCYHIAHSDQIGGNMTSLNWQGPARVSM